MMKCRMEPLKAGSVRRFRYPRFGRLFGTGEIFYASPTPPANAGLNPDLVIGGGSFGAVSGTMTSDLFLQSDAGVTTIWQLTHQSISKTTFLLYLPKAGATLGA